MLTNLSKLLQIHVADEFKESEMDIRWREFNEVRVWEKQILVARSPWRINFVLGA